MSAGLETGLAEAAIARRLPGAVVAAVHGIPDMAQPQLEERQWRHTLLVLQVPEEEDAPAVVALEGSADRADAGGQVLVAVAQQRCVQTRLDCYKLEELMSAVILVVEAVPEEIESVEAEIVAGVERQDWRTSGHRTQ
jgi:hypothetical protein